MQGEEKKKKSTARFGGHCIGFLIPTVIVGLRGWNKSGCGQRTGEVEQVNSFTSAPISRALFFSPSAIVPPKVSQAAYCTALPCSA